MKIFGINFSKNQVKQNIQVSKDTVVSHVDFSAPPLPKIIESRGKDWIYYGEDNLYPQHLKRIIMQSPTQGAIIKGKSGMLAGNGILVNGAKSIIESESLLKTLESSVVNDYKLFLDNEHDILNVNEINTKICLDLAMYGSFAIEVVWSMDFTRIATIKYVDVSNIRSGKLINGKVLDYYYSRDWSYASREGFIPKRIASFDVNNKSEYNQLIYIKSGNLEYYGDPTYSEGLSWVEIEGKLANFHLSNITNGFAPSMALKFYQKPGGPEEQSIIVNGIKKQYAGTGNAGRAMIFFSDGKDNAPDIDAIPVSNLDKQYAVVNDLTIQNILTANQVTSPLLFGISTPGQLGGNNELATAYKIYNSSVVAPDRRKIENIWNQLLQINGIPITITLLPFNPLGNEDDTNSLTLTNDDAINVVNKLKDMPIELASKIVDKLNDNDIRSLIGLNKNKIF
jgi:hypothetical protein